MSEGTMSYMATCPGCGHVVALTIDDDERKKATAKRVAAWIAGGLRVERKPSKEARALFNVCECAEPLPQMLLPKQRKKKKVALPPGWQKLTLTVYLEGEPTQWELHAPVYGVWAVHRPYPGEASDEYWHVTHAPTSVMLVRIASHDIAVIAAKRLAEIEPPVIVIKTDTLGRKYPKMDSGKWFEQAARVLADLGEWELGGYTLCAPESLYYAIRRVQMTEPSPSN